MQISPWALTRALVLASLLACSDPQTPAPAPSLTEGPGRFAAHAHYNPVGPRYPGAVEIEETVRDLPRREGHCATLQSVYGTQDPQGRAISFYVSLGFRMPAHNFGGRWIGHRPANAERRSVEIGDGMLMGYRAWKTAIISSREDCSEAS